MTVSEQLGLNLRKARRGACMSQDDLSKRTGLHHTEISLLERGARVPRIDTCIKILEGTNADPLFGVLFEGIAWHEPAHWDEKGWFTIAGTDGPVDLRLPRPGATIDDRPGIRRDRRRLRGRPGHPRPPLRPPRLRPLRAIGGTAEEALRLFRHQRPDLLVVDLELLDGEGPGLLRRIREAHWLRASTFEVVMDRSHRQSVARERLCAKRAQRAADTDALASGLRTISEMKRDNEVFAPFAIGARIDLGASRRLG